MRAPTPLAVTATYNERTVHALAIAVAADPARVYLIEPEGEGAALVERAVPSFDALRRSPGLPRDGRFRHFTMAPDGQRAALVLETPAGPVLEALDLRGAPGWSGLLDDSRLEGLRWSSDGGRLFVGWSNGIVRVFDAARGAQADCLAIPGVEALSADGSRYARWKTRRGKRWLALVDEASRREVGLWACGAKREEGHDRVAVAPSGDAVWWVYAAGQKTALCRYEPGARDERVTLEGRVALFVPLADGAALMTYEGRFARLRVRDAGELVVAWQDASRAHFGGSPFDGGYVSHNAVYAAAWQRDVVALLDLEDGRELHPPDGHVGHVRFLTASPDGSRLAAVWARGEVALLDATTLSPEITFELGAGPVACAFAPDGREIHAVMEGAITSLSVRDGSSRSSVLLSQGPSGWGDEGFAVSPDGATAAMVTSVWDASRPQPECHLLRLELATGRTSRIPVPPSIGLLAPRFIHGGGQIRAIVNHGERALVTLDAITGRTVASLSLEAHIQALPHDVGEDRNIFLTLSPAGTTVVAALPHGPGTELLAVADDGAAPAHVTAPNGEVLALDGHRLAWLADGDASEEVQVYDLDALLLTARLPLTRDQYVRSACFVAGGALALGLDDGRVLRVAEVTGQASPVG